MTNDFKSERSCSAESWELGTIFDREYNYGSLIKITLPLSFESEKDWGELY